MKIEPSEKKRIEQEFIKILGEGFGSLYLYGFAKQKKSLRYNVLLVLGTVDVSILNKIQKMSISTQKQILDIKIFSKTELENGLDVFPIEFLDIKKDHLLITGDDILFYLDIDDKNLRHECEFYLRSNILKLRELFIKKIKEPHALIKDSLSSFVSVFYYLAKLFDLEMNFNSTEDMIIKLAKKMGFDSKVFIDVISLEKNKDLKDIFPKYLFEISKIIQKVDQIEN